MRSVSYIKVVSFALLTPLVLPNCTTGSETPGPKTEETPAADERTSAEIGRGFYREVILDKDVSKFDQYVGDTYLQHATGYEDGVEPLREELAANAGEEYNLVNILRVVGEGDYAALHSLWEYKENKVVYVDVWKIEGGKLVEHWDHFQDVPREAANDNTIYLGPDTDVDAGQDVEQNRARTLAVLATFDSLADLSAVEDYVADDYMQHNPTVADGKDAFLDLLRELKEAGYKSETTIAKTLASGDMVLVHSKVSDLSKANDLGTGAFDIFRFNAQGQIAEHWDVLEPQTGESLNDNDPFAY